MSNLKKTVSKLRQRKRDETKRTRQKYDRLIQKLQEKCTEHEFNNWHTQMDNIHGGYRTNLFGTPVQFRKCKICGKTEEYVEDHRQ